ncbi:MAG: HNH endonuclease, partial [Gammaproteobacteria bacterium]|nr:HNH endonuclease [Gammaproteobacteria bacterium]
MVFMIPSAERQLLFLQQLQRLFDEGEFVATYKFALLMALAEISVESNHVDGKLEIPMIAIAEKFAELYWPQTVPYSSGTAT